ncbi:MULTISPECIES: SCP2 sterol-binding domain-containing protein [unclassified Streptomyces]|uniref:SCP2 sterol-binding domain-containing protein n=1 Tax=unclassified Streptomyces TaxID=2593676 RepID=UPI0011CCC233|nr:MULTISPECIES: SCP2 sterol-binding domain-containing protein [unclassified Streptomyces]WSQ76285.1 SCP2 sterol-binding domain-containing protein [Streptomyces sp. NBC_01213]TXS13254.1 acyl-CoA synthase [Streptomyces sp. wa22]WSQ83532.1 SCP2 sterol-binding domain-containing protein [Streptomyces sp. NBC_01212]WSR10438.1 SCP2 sterol-binding domain-containing protein [Streptomyces sp. NBC_01208]WSR46869.1 SCP2 sterol-binding domain-containing protein [Streptomyces sp. NBC_01201]
MADNSSGNLTDELSGLDFAAVSPEDFARIVKGLSAEQLGEVMHGDLRTRVLSEVFGRMRQQFRPEAAGRLKALIRWKITGENEEVYETSIADGACTVSAGRSDAEPRTTLVMGDAEFLKLVSGNGNPVTMFMMRRLKVVGDVGLASGLTRYFDIPKA